MYPLHQFEIVYFYQHQKNVCMLRICCVLVLLLPTIAFAQEEDYEQTIEDHREQIYQEFKSRKTTPFAEEVRYEFKGFEYYRLDPSYRVEAKFVLTPEEKPFKMNTSSGKLRDYVKYGVASFELDGQQLEVNLYQNLAFKDDPEHGNQLFLPFTDHTCGKGSYGGGRYLDITIPKDSTIVIDFNLAYNPYCAYSDGYSCPIPPKENDLPVGIHAGVRKWKNVH